MSREHAAVTNQEKSLMRRTQKVVTSFSNRVLHSLIQSSQSLIFFLVSSSESDSLQSALLRANSVGTDYFPKFLKKRVESSKIPLYRPLKKNKLKTIKSKVEKKNHQVDSNNVTVTADRDMFTQMLLIQEVRKELLSIRELVKYSLGPLPLALATGDGGLQKTSS